MYFSEDETSRLYADLAVIEAKCAHLFERFLLRNYQHGRGKEFAQHGFMRRLKVVTRCIERVFALIPPEMEVAPDADIRTETEIYIQAFLANIFGCFDNLAWMLLYEKPISQDNGEPVPPAWIGLRPSNTFLRGKLSAETREYLHGLDGWFGYMENYRHALAHRIPLYIPPAVVSPDHPDGVFRPWIMHSFEEPGVHPFVFHPQMLSDFSTVEAVGLRIVGELN